MGDTVSYLEQEIEALKLKLKQKESELYRLKFGNENLARYGSSMSKTEVTRYSRQMLVPSINPDGQFRLRGSKVLIIGAGGLGCPAALYLAAAGVGEITIVDHDEVELTNLHRQILHYQTDIRKPKVQSVADKLYSLNCYVHVIPVQVHANSASLVHILNQKTFDVVLDCTDNVPTRYLISDACVLHKIPLVSGSALQMEGQLTVYNYKNGPCYRCLFPLPPSPDLVVNCAVGGVLGAVCGTIGVLQALEAIKIITNMPGVLAGRMLILDGADTTFRNVKLRDKCFKCKACQDPTELFRNAINYEQFCGSRADDKPVDINILPKHENIRVEDLFSTSTEDKLIIDVRPSTEYKMCCLPNTYNFPIYDISSGASWKAMEEIIRSRNCREVFMICRRGNDSQIGAACLKKALQHLNCRFINVTGGLYSYAQRIDANFPLY